MQKILVKKTVDGKEKMFPLFVIRSWSQEGAASIFLFRGGAYGYRNGDPVRTRMELENSIADPGQLRQALGWWDRKGKAEAARHYEKLGNQMDRRAELSQRAAEALEGENLEAKLYRITDSGEVTDTAASWTEAGFARRPDWWGPAETIKIGDRVYESVESLENEQVRKSADAGRKTAPKPVAEKSSPKQKMAEEL